MLNNDSVEKSTNMQQAFFFPLLRKKHALKNKKIFNINNLIIALTKMRMLIFLAFSQYGLVSKYGTIFEISIYDWTMNCIF